VLLAGCGPPPAAEVTPLECYPVAGTVFVSGAPAAGARLTFYPTPPRDDLPSSFKTITDAAGRFVGSTNTVGDGLPPGRYTITMTWPEELGDSPETESDRLQGRFADPKRSRLTAEVKKQPNQLPPFHLR
jgi:hypothetical protein